MTFTWKWGAVVTLCAYAHTWLDFSLSSAIHLSRKAGRMLQN